jgi:cation diffusion facilitator CzcD-associated flavoprotein CzcO
MSSTSSTEALSGNPVVTVDVLVVGAGISGVGAAWHLKHQRPGTTFAVLESKDTFGGTWVTHRYPGIRSDSDLYTFGYRFKPWTGAPIATAAEILQYMGEVIDENGLAPSIHYRHQVLSAAWSGSDQRWTVEVLCTGTQQRQTHKTYRAAFLWMCQGYYKHDQGYTPAWPGMADFQGRIVHPQTWPDDLDLTGQRVVVIGSGATAATLIPAVAGHCAHVTMLQRSPTYFRTARNINELADLLRELDIPEAWTHEIVRRKILLDQGRFAQMAKAQPDAVKRELLANVRSILGDDFDVDRHFNPSYRPWQQRVAFIPDADLFQAIKSGQASVVTDGIECFTPQGLKLTSGAELAADVIVTATGFELSALGEIPFSIDGRPLAFHDTVTWHGAMFTGVPNLLWVFGYLRWSWTLRVDLMGDLVCRLLDDMQARGARVVTPQLRADEAGMPLRPWVEPDNFNPGYLMRGLHRLPHQGDHAPWLHEQDYAKDKDLLPQVDLHDGSLRFT